MTNTVSWDLLFSVYSVIAYDFAGGSCSRAIGTDNATDFNVFARADNSGEYKHGSRLAITRETLVNN